MIPKKFVVKVRFPWWVNGKRVADRFGWVVGKTGAEYIIRPQDNSKERIHCYMTEFEVIHLK